MPHRAVTVTSHYAGAVPGLSPDHDAYQAILDTYQRVTDDQYNTAMADMATTRTPSHDEKEPSVARTPQERAEADAKFFALRESGYTGGIDQDGNKDNRYDQHFANLNHGPGKTDTRKQK